jgi:hypothetical protein
MSWKSLTLAPVLQGQVGPSDSSQAQQNSQILNHKKAPMQ